MTELQQIAQERDDLIEVVLRALIDTDQSPFHREDSDTQALAAEIADGVIAAGWKVGA